MASMLADTSEWLIDSEVGRNAMPRLDLRVSTKDDQIKSRACGNMSSTLFYSELITGEK